MNWVPPSGADLPRFAGVPSFMRLPALGGGDPRLAEVEVALLGLPWDGGATNRPGARHGPRALRDASSMIRAEHPRTGQRPFEAMRCADLGDVAVSPVDQDSALEAIRAAASALPDGCRPLCAGGDHLTTLPVLRALAAREGPLGLVLLDSHTDLYPAYFGGRVLTHGNPFRSAVEEGLIDPARTVMIGMRGTAYDRADRDFASAHGIRIVDCEEMLSRGTEAVAEEARGIATGRCYLSLDVDFVDPAFAPGTGTPEVGGPTSAQAIALVRALRGLDLAGADLVEVSPPFDTGGITAWLGASLLFELLCLMAPAGRP